jgi:hypothetical protein
MSTRNPVGDESSRSPLAGCLILITAVLVLVFLIVFSTLVLFRQHAEISKFTFPESTAIEVSELIGKEEALSRLGEQLREFQLGLDRGGSAELRLGADEINLAIAAYAEFADLRGTFSVREIGPDVMRIAISFPLNGRPRLAREGEPGWIATDRMYLNGTMVARAALTSGEFVLEVIDLEVEGRNVPEEFISRLSPYRICERYRDHPLNCPAMKRLTRVGMTDGAVVLSSIPGESPAGTIDQGRVDSAAGRFFTVFALAACLFLVFAGTVVFIGLRARSRRTR